MAILSKIRERSMFLIIVIGLALFSFVLSPKDIIDFFSEKSANTVGEIAGEEITRIDFAKEVDERRTNNPSISTASASNLVWNDKVSEIIYKTASEKAGVSIGEQDLWEEITKLPEIQMSPLFKNEAGFFDGEKLKNYLADMKLASEEDPNNRGWQAWKKSEKSIAQGLKKRYYQSLIRLGLGASFAGAKEKFLQEETKINGSYVYVPYEKIPDTKIKVGAPEIENYIEAHSDQFQTEEKRDVKFVKFDIAPSVADLQHIKQVLNELKKEASIFSTAETDSDLPLDKGFKYENQLPSSVADQILAAKKGVIIGPYELNGYYKLTKVLDFKVLPDSVKAQHILISYKGSRGVDAEITRDEQAAKKLADSILKVVKRDKKMFQKLAKKFSADASNAADAGNLDWFNYNAMVPEFRDFCFLKKTGATGVVKTDFGFHIIKIKGQKNPQRTVEMATYSRKLNASESTENKIYQNATVFAQDLKEGADYDELVASKKYKSQSTEGIEALSSNVGVLTNQRNIVRWTFEDERKIGDSKRFDVEGGYAVVLLSGKTAAGLMSAKKALPKVKPILQKQQKFQWLAGNTKTNDLEKIAKGNSVTVQNFNSVSIASPIISGVGTEPAVVGTIYATKKGATSRAIAGEKGVFWVKILEKNTPNELPTYQGIYEAMVSDYKTKLRDQNIEKALKKKAKIKDYRERLF